MDVTDERSRMTARQAPGKGAATADAAVVDRPNPLAAFFREWAAQDWVILVYLVVLLLAVLHGDGPRRPTALLLTFLDVVVFTAAVSIARGTLLGSVGSAVLYRFSLLFGILGSFLQLQWILPSASGAPVDAQLYAFDLLVFRIEPAELFDRVTTPGTTDWFSFFYFGYFPLLAVYVLPFMFAVRRTRLLAEMSFGIAWVFCVAHLVYLAVPGHGPYIHLASRFVHPLDGPTFWPLVKGTVDAVDITARTDIFPSLHTAAPTFLTAFAFRHRRMAPFRQVWIPAIFVTSQIVIATMFLRWHYLIDVVVGLCHGLSTAWLAGRIAGREEERRGRDGRRPVWTTPW